MSETATCQLLAGIVATAIPWTAWYPANAAGRAKTSPIAARARSDLARPSAICAMAMVAIADITAATSEAMVP